MIVVAMIREKKLYLKSELYRSRDIRGFEG